MTTPFEIKQTEPTSFEIKQTDFATPRPTYYYPTVFGRGTWILNTEGYWFRWTENDKLIVEGGNSWKRLWLLAYLK